MECAVCRYQRVKREAGACKTCGLDIARFGTPEGDRCGVCFRLDTLGATARCVDHGVYGYMVEHPRLAQTKCCGEYAHDCGLQQLRVYRDNAGHEYCSICLKEKALEDGFIQGTHVGAFRNVGPTFGFMPDGDGQAHLDQVGSPACYCGFEKNRDVMVGHSSWCRSRS